MDYDSKRLGDYKPYYFDSTLEILRLICPPLACSTFRLQAMRTGARHRAPRVLFELIVAKPDIAH